MRSSQSGILIFCNMALVLWYRKRNIFFQTLTFGSELTALKQGIDLSQTIKYKLRMFGVPLNRAANMYCNNEAVYKNTAIKESLLYKRHHSVAYHACRKALYSGMVRI